MGWLRTSPNAGKSLHKLAAKVEVEVEETPVEPKHPIQPKKVKDHDLPFVSAEEVKRHDGKDGRRVWIVVDQIVLDATEYLHHHPGGQQIILGFAGQDCSWQWWSFHNRKLWNEHASLLRVGRTEGVENLHVKPKAFVGLRPLGYQDE